MKKKYLICFFAFLLVNANLNAQISGFVYDSKTKAPIEGVFVFVKHKAFSTITDKSGYFNIKENIYKEDTIYFTVVGYTNKYLTNHITYKDSLCVYLENTENIDSVVVTHNKGRRKSQKIGDLRRPSRGILGMFSNTNYSLRYEKTSKISYINNRRKKEGQIDKVLVKFLDVKYKTLTTDLKSKGMQNTYLKNPEYIKLEILCLGVSDSGEPANSLSDEKMIFTITSYGTQWIDISKYRVPFPEKGAFVGMKILEVRGEDGWGNVYVPLLYSTEERKNDMFYEYEGKWVLRNNKINIFGKERYYTFGFGAEVSYEN
ncbi:MAG: carboxypeptidase-like regulatory domain-containing protein [Thermonemataceae bacterium]|nr:carboxypeptidase-like regulatory domain-containing protein [Thermonemataceae bacterium]